MSRVDGRRVAVKGELDNSLLISGPPLSFEVYRGSADNCVRGSCACETAADDSGEP